MLSLFADSWAAAGWDIAAPVVPVVCAIVVLAIATRTVWSCGVISFAPIAIAAVGGMVAANILLAGYGLGLALAGAGIVGFWLGLMVAVLLGRLPAHAQTLISLALAALVAPVARTLPSWTGGIDGISVVAIIPPGGGLAGLVCLAVLGAIVLGASGLDRSWFAIAARAVRHGPALASAMGIEPRFIRSVGFGIAGLLAGLGGTMLVLGAGVAAPATFPLSFGFVALAAALAGGSLHWSGPLLGGVIFAMPIALLGTGNSATLDIATAVVVVMLLIFLPRGLLDPRDSLRREARERRQQRRVTHVVAPPTSDDRHRQGSRRGRQSGNASRLNAAIKRRTGAGT